ncbi:hypothetical protein GOP47_0001547 [Adiantum capillus-veneris]|uniref:Uncharacterized protein n=1 Tax=Adiantum capillus-veneris TaxID=13818 RepID=A0A9D4ZNC9_ADICA|nr:hypothetical protein GOP47_0001547 [Adiantum capillus-veneris]
MNASDQFGMSLATGLSIFTCVLLLASRYKSWYCLQKGQRMDSVYVFSFAITTQVGRGYPIKSHKKIEGIKADTDEGGIGTLSSDAAVRLEGCVGELADREARATQKTERPFASQACS